MIISQNNYFLCIHAYGNDRYKISITKLNKVEKIIREERFADPSRSAPGSDREISALFFPAQSIQFNYLHIFQLFQYLFHLLLSHLTHPILIYVDFLRFFVPSIPLAWNHPPQQNNYIANIPLLSQVGWTWLCLILEMKGSVIVNLLENHKVTCHKAYFSLSF